MLYCFKNILEKLTLQLSQTQNMQILSVSHQLNSSGQGVNQPSYSLLKPITGDHGSAIGQYNIICPRFYFSGTQADFYLRACEFCLQHIWWPQKIRQEIRQEINKFGRLGVYLSVSLVTIKNQIDAFVVTQLGQYRFKSQRNFQTESRCLPCWYIGSYNRSIGK